LDDNITITENEGVGKSDGNLKVYVLDKSEKKDNLIRDIARDRKLIPFEILPVRRLKSEKVTGENIGDFVYPSPAEWLRGFQDAEFVIKIGRASCRERVLI